MEETGQKDCPGRLIEVKKRKWMIFCLTAVMVMGAGRTVYAGTAGGPASDGGAIAAETQENSGPGGPASETQENKMTEPENGQEAGTSVQGASGTAEAVPEGMIASGGRFLDPGKPMVALTFDDGPYAPVGSRIMDCLEQYDGRSTFFVVGNRIPTYQAEILRMQANGHEVANHTQDHKYLTNLNAEQIRAQVEQCNQMIASVTGQSPALMRLPGGLKNSTVLANIHQPIIMWSIDTRDWKTRNAANTVQVILSQVRDGDIILMHELYGATAEAVEAVVPALAAQGYQLVTVSELAALRGGMAPGVLYSSFR